MGKKSYDAPVKKGLAVGAHEKVPFMMYCRGVSLVVLLVSFLCAIFYASSRVRFVEDVLPQISGALIVPPLFSPRSLILSVSTKTKRFEAKGEGTHQAKRSPPPLPARS